MTYRVDAPLKDARCCHCSRCRKAFSGAGSAYAEVEPGAFSWENGAEDFTVFRTHGAWGMAFCRQCGTTLAGMNGDDVHGVTLGSVDGDPGVVVARHIFVGSKAPWDEIGGDAPQFDGHVEP